MEYWSVGVSMINTQLPHHFHHSIVPVLHHSISRPCFLPSARLAGVKSFDKPAIIKFLNEGVIDKRFRVSLLDLRLFFSDLVQNRLNSFERRIGNLVVKSGCQKVIREFQITAITLLLRLDPEFFAHYIEALSFVLFEVRHTFDVTFHEFERPITIVAQEGPSAF